MSEKHPTFAEPLQEAAHDQGTGLSFEQFETAKKGVSDDTILGIMEGNLEIVPGEKAILIKSFLDNVPSDESDAEFAKNPDKVISFRERLSDFVGSNLRLKFRPDAVGANGKGYLQNAKQNFLNKLETDKPLVAAFINGVYQEDKDRPRYPDSAFEFYGMKVEASDGKKVDLLTNGVNGIYPNMYMQREIGGMFVHMKSDAYATERLHSKKPELSKRIYLNPKIEQSIDIFEQIMVAANEAGICMQGKIFDRSAEVVGANRKKNPGEYGMRGDGIVLYAGEDANELLSLVEAIYKDNSDAFAGRKTSKVPLKIGEGVAIGDEPDVDGASLTSHRAALLEAVRSETRSRLSMGPDDKFDPARSQDTLRVFRAAYEEMAVQAGISPKNIAFNLKKAA